MRKRNENNSHHFHKIIYSLIWDLILIAKNKKNKNVGDTADTDSQQYFLKLWVVSGQATKAIPLSKTRDELSQCQENIKEQMLAEIKYNAKFSLQIDESTNFAS
jgi:hypothetical protein